LEAGSRRGALAVQSPACVYPPRRTVWLNAALLLLAVVAGSWLLVPRSRITQENFERIQDGMKEAEVCAILGEAENLNGLHRMSVSGGHWCERRYWRNGATRISVSFDNCRAYEKEIHFASAWETLTWYAKKGAAKIGVKWD
jgi:hypothetical protein